MASIVAKFSRERTSSRKQCSRSVITSFTLQHRHPQTTRHVLLHHPKPLCYSMCIRMALGENSGSCIRFWTLNHCFSAIAITSCTLHLRHSYMSCAVARMHAPHCWPHCDFTETGCHWGGMENMCKQEQGEKSSLMYNAKSAVPKGQYMCPKMVLGGKCIACIR